MTIELDTVLQIPTRVKALQEEFKITTGFPTEPATNAPAKNYPTFKQSLGWFIQFEGSLEKIFIGAVKPDNLDVGDSVYWAIQKPRKTTGETP